MKKSQMILLRELLSVMKLRVDEPWVGTLARWKNEGLAVKEAGVYQ